MCVYNVCMMCEQCVLQCVHVMFVCNVCTTCVLTVLQYMCNVCAIYVCNIYVQCVSNVCKICVCAIRVQCVCAIWGVCFPTFLLSLLWGSFLFRETLSSICLVVPSSLKRDLFLLSLSWFCSCEEQLL